MAEDVAIKVDGVSKTFKLPHEKQTSLKGLFVNLFRGKRRYEKQEVLKDISFEVRKGEFFGIVGRNGSGKSTLLKLLAGIYTPDKGHIQVNGKLTPFIELGVGFNPELTGRENVFLNGALLGFNRKDMQAMYDEIVDFAELEKFMDQKLKNYSSGMQVRLAFSIAIRVNSEILVLDEVLAVGDEAFQRKCNEYFVSLKGSGKTVILVTHSMDAVRKYCNRAALIRSGELVMVGTSDDVANQYTEDNFGEPSDSTRSESGLSERVPYFKITPRSKQILTGKDELKFQVEYEITDDTSVSVFFSIIDERRGGTILANGTKPIKGRGRHKLTYVFPIRYYNDTNILVIAVLDEADTKERIAYTNDANSCRFAIRNRTSDNGLLRRDNGIHGHWIGYEEYGYNLKEM